MPREKRRPEGSGKTAQDWGIVVRLADDSQLYYYVDQRHVDSRGNPLELWGRMSQAHRFPSEEHARRAAAAMQGASLLAQRPLLVIDLTGQHAAGMLTAATQRIGIPAMTYRLPHDLGRCGLLAELSAAQLADAIAEALHAGVPGGARADRAIDARVLQQLADVLAGRGVTPPAAGRRGPRCARAHDPGRDTQRR